MHLVSYRISRSVGLDLPPMTNMPDTENPDDVYCGGCKHFERSVGKHETSE